jgi:hypothetical protein
MHSQLLLLFSGALAIWHHAFLAQPILKLATQATNTVCIENDCQAAAVTLVNVCAAGNGLQGQSSVYSRIH